MLEVLIPVPAHVTLFGNRILADVISSAPSHPHPTPPHTHTRTAEGQRGNSGGGRRGGSGNLALLPRGQDLTCWPWPLSASSPRPYQGPSRRVSSSVSCSSRPEVSKRLPFCGPSPDRPLLLRTQFYGSTAVPGELGTARSCCEAPAG